MTAMSDAAPPAAKHYYLTFTVVGGGLSPLLLPRPTAESVREIAAADRADLERHGDPDALPRYLVALARRTGRVALEQLP